MAATQMARYSLRHGEPNQSYILQLYHEEGKTESLIPHQNLGGNEKQSHDSLLGRKGGKWEMTQQQLLTSFFCYHVSEGSQSIWHRNRAAAVKSLLCGLCEKVQGHQGTSTELFPCTPHTNSLREGKTCPFLGINDIYIILYCS